MSAAMAAAGVLASTRGIGSEARRRAHAAGVPGSGVRGCAHTAGMLASQIRGAAPGHGKLRAGRVL